jgi:hypothetical protein
MISIMARIIFLKTKNQEKYFSGILVLIFDDVPKY